MIRTKTNTATILFKLHFLLFILVTLGANAQTISVEENDQKASEFLKSGNKAEAARLYTQSAFYYRNHNNLDKSIEYYLKVLQLNTELNNRVGIMLTHSNLSMLYIESEDYNSALRHLKDELSFRKQNKKPNETLPVLLTIAAVQNELSDFSAAEATAMQAIDIAKEINELKSLKSAYGTAFDIYSKKGDNTKAQEYFELYNALDTQIKKEMMAQVESEAKQKVSAAESAKALTETQLQETNKELKQTVSTLQEAERVQREQQMELDLRQAKINEQNATLRVERLRKRFWAFGFVVALLFILVLGYLVWKIRLAQQKIEAQKQKLEIQNKEIRSSIHYAETIQKAMLTDLAETSSFGESFVVFRPKDIVSGDFYWSAKLSDQTMFFAVVDCTGHGVPGAFMSMIGLRILTEIVMEMKITSPAMVLENLNNMIRTSLRQEQTDNNDGMDLALVRFDKQKGGSTKVTFSGAKRPLYIARPNKTDLEVLKPDRKSIGGHQTTKRDIQFNDQEVILNPGDEIFLFSDGITDQNDPYRKKFGRARLESILLDCFNDSIEEQKNTLETKLNGFMKGEEQRDDITIAGFKFI